MSAASAYARVDAPRFFAALLAWRANAAMLSALFSVTIIMSFNDVSSCFVKLHAFYTALVTELIAFDAIDHLIVLAKVTPIDFNKSLVSFNSVLEVAIPVTNFLNACSPWVPA
jgi:hypothetical protein